MKLVLSYEELQKVLGYCNVVLNDKSVEDKLKNFIFSIKDDEVKVSGYNVFTFCRVTVENVEELADIPENGWEFQVKSSALNKVLQSYSSLYKTKAKTVEFSEDGVKIRVTVHEEAVDEKDSALTQDVDYYLESSPILSNTLKDIHLPFPEDTDMVNCEDIFLYIDCLFPLMNNDTGNSRESKLNFADDYIFVMSSYSSAFMQNKLPDAFKNLTITYSSTGFLKKVCESAEPVLVAKTDKHLCVQSGNVEAFMKYQKVKINYTMFVEKKSKETGIKLDRMYLKDVLKRMGNVSPEGKMLVTDSNELVVENDHFHQVVPIMGVKGNASGIGFNVSVPLLEKIIVGRDDVFPEEIFLYFVPTPRGYILYLQDSTGGWFSNTQVARL